MVPQLQEVVELVGMGMEEEDMDILVSVELHPSALPTASVFKMDIKPKEPPVFRGTAAEDVDTWLAKVEDFIYLTEANTRQQVAYMATLLQDAAGDWWTALLKERHGSRPADYTEMSALLRKRFGSSTTSGQSTRCAEEYQTVNQ